MSLPKSKFHDLLLTSHVCVLALGLGFLNLAGVVVWYKVCIPDSGKSSGGVRLPVFYLEGSVLTMGVRYPGAETYRIQFWSSWHVGKLGWQCGRQPETKREGQVSAGQGY